MTPRAVAEGEQLYRLLAENTTDLITLYDLQGTRMYASPSCERVLGTVPEALAGGVHPDDQPLVHDMWQQVLDAGAASATYRHARRDGSWCWLEVSGCMVQYRGAPHVLAVSRDITKRRHAEEERMLAEQRFRAFVDHATDGLFLVGADGRIVDVNQRACENLGYMREELIGKLAAEFSQAAPTRPEVILDTLAKDGVVTIQSCHVRKDGSSFPVEVRLRSFVDHGQGFGIALVRDLTDRQRAERELDESQKLFDIVITNTSDAVFVKDTSGRYLMANTAALRVLGRRAFEVLGRTVPEIWDGESASIIVARDRRALEAGSLTFEETLMVDGRPRTFVGTENVYRDVNGNVLGLVGILRDVTELKQLEEQLRQAQKMEAVGRLAGGIAHDFNNLLMVINSYSEMLLASLPGDDNSREMLEEIGKAGERAAALTRQLLAFSRKQVLRARVLDLDGVVRDLARLLQRVIGETIALTADLEPGLGRVRIDPALFQQAITNLVVNARDAMPRGGTITIEARNLEIRDGDARGLAPGSYVFVGVRDTGEGMESAVRARVFEPFFTTKEPGHGTGLGLAMVYGFVSQSGGHIEVESAPGNGAWFKIYLPRVIAPASARPRTEEPEPPSGTETVLLVEDEEMVRRVTRLTLESLGYSVLEAKDGRSAHDIAKSHPGDIHVVLSDVVMPTLSGPEVAALVASVRGDVRVIFMSGYAANPSNVAADAAFLQKPFRLDDLARKLREVLDRR